MKRTHLAALGIASALSSGAALAVSGDAWYGTNRFTETAPIVIAAEPAERVHWYEERSVPAPAIVERRVVYEPRDYYYLPRDLYVARVDNDWVKELNPQTGHRIGDGLFNTEGPNDFGQ